MDFSFAEEQDDLRREARAFLEANPAPSDEQLAELGWVGILDSGDFTFLDAAVLFEELGRVHYATSRASWGMLGTMPSTIRNP